MLKAILILIGVLWGGAAIVSQIIGLKERRALNRIWVEKSERRNGKGIALIGKNGRELAVITKDSSFLQGNRVIATDHGEAVRMRFGEKDTPCFLVKNSEVEGLRNPLIGNGAKWGFFPEK